MEYSHSHVAGRLGVGSALVQACERKCCEWGDSDLFLKVRTDNAAACALYQSLGYEGCGMRDATGVPEWQLRWKGSLVPLQLLRKTVDRMPARDWWRSRFRQSEGERVPVRRYSEFKVTIDQVKAYRDKDAYVWFVLLILRNAAALSPAYRILPAAAIAATCVGYQLIVHSGF
jgi:hypothetical protein